VNKGIIRSDEGAFFLLLFLFAQESQKKSASCLMLQIYAIADVVDDLVCVKEKTPSRLGTFQIARKKTNDLLRQRYCACEGIRRCLNFCCGCCC